MKKSRTKPRRGRPPGRNWSPLMLSLTPARRAIAEQMGETAAKGIYALLDFAAANPALAAKVNAAQSATDNGKSDA